MSKSRLVGLTSIVFGANALITTTINTCATLRLLNIVPGTAKISIPMPTKNKYFVEDTDYPDIVLSEQAGGMVEFAIRDILPSFLIAGLGGTSSATLTYYAPTSPRGVVERSAVLVSKTYGGKLMTFTIPRLEISASADLRFSNKAANEPGVQTFQCEILQGTRAGGVTLLPPWKMVRS